MGQKAIIKVVGVGGAGNNAINRMRGIVKGVEFIAVNTDTQDLDESTADVKVAIGEKTTKGLGSGGNPRVGQEAAEESKDEIKKKLEGADLIYITAGMGGGTGTGASPIVAMCAKELGIMTIGVVTKPFDFEGKPRMKNAEIGINNLSKFVDCNIIIPNQQLVKITKTGTTMKQAFEIADSVVIDGVRCITDLLAEKTLINIDLNDVKTVMQNSGIAHMGIGRAKGENRLLHAIQQAVQSPILETSIEKASRIILCIFGGDDLTIHEVENYGRLIKDLLDEDCFIKFAANIDAKYADEVQIIIIATGFPQSLQKVDSEKAAPKNTNAQFAGQIQANNIGIAKTVTQPKLLVEEPVNENKNDSNVPLYIRRLRDKK